MFIDSDYACLKYDGAACDQQSRSTPSYKTGKVADVVCFRITKCEDVRIFVVEKTTSRLENDGDVEERISKIEDSIAMLKKAFSVNDLSLIPSRIKVAKIIICDGISSSVRSGLGRKKRDYNIYTVKELKACKVESSPESEEIDGKIAKYVNCNYTR